MSDRERNKKSWRDVDAQRDRGGPTKPGAGAGASGGRASDDRASKQYRAQLDALFEKGELGKFAEKLAQGRGAPAAAATPAPAPSSEAAPAAQQIDPGPDVASGERLALRKKILEAIGRDEISRAVDKYCKQFGMPADFECLEQALEHNKEKRVHEALTALETLLGRHQPKRSRTLVGKLKYIEETTGDTDLAEFATRVRTRIESPRA